MANTDRDHHSCVAVTLEPLRPLALDTAACKALTALHRSRVVIFDEAHGCVLVTWTPMFC